MKRLAAIIGFVLLSLAWNASAEEQTVNFSGEWTFNQEKSDSTSRVTPIGSAAAAKVPVGRVPYPKMQAGRAAGAKLPPGVQPKPKAPISPPVAARGAVMNPNVMTGRGFGGGTFDGTTPVATDVPLVITQTATEMHIVNALSINGKNVPNTETYKLDGNKYKETIQDNSGSEITREIEASLKKNKIKIEIVTDTPERGRFRTTREFTLSEDGRTLTVEASFQGPKALSSQKMVYDRR